MNTRNQIRPDFDNATPAERAAWRLILSWERRGVLVQQAYLTSHAN